MNSRKQIKTNKNEKLSNHLGNVLAVITDRKIAGDFQNSDGIIDFVVEYVSITDYCPFGMTMKSRSWSGGGYRYGFNGVELDPEGMGGGGGSWDGDLRYDKFGSTTFKGSVWGAGLSVGSEPPVVSYSIYDFSITVPTRGKKMLFSGSATLLIDYKGFYQDMKKVYNF